MSRLHFALHREPDVGSLLFHSGPNIHWGSLTSQTTSFWFDREVIISSKPLPPSSFVHPTHPPPTAGREGVIETSKLLKWLVFLTQHVYMSRNGHVSYDVGFEGGDGGVAPINSLMNVRLHTSTSITTHPLPADSLWGWGNMFLPVLRLKGGYWWQCDWRHMHTHRVRANRDTQTSRGFVLLCGFVFLQAQQRSVCLNPQAKRTCCIAHAWL